MTNLALGGRPSDAFQTFYVVSLIYHFQSSATSISIGPLGRAAHFGNESRLDGSRGALGRQLHPQRQRRHAFQLHIGYCSVSGATRGAKTHLDTTAARLLVRRLALLQALSAPFNTGSDRAGGHREA